MAIILQTGFELNANEPIVNNLRVENLADLATMQYKWVGLQTYVNELSKHYTYKGMLLGWQASTDGIYGGSGSLSGDTAVYMGSIGATISNTSNSLSFTTNDGENDIKMNTFFNRNKTSIDGLRWDGVDFTQQWTYDDKNGPYIKFNSQKSPTTSRGDLSFGSGIDVNLKERLRIDGSGKIGFNLAENETIKGFMQINNNFGAALLNLYNDTNESTILSYNYYDDGGSNKGFHDDRQGLGASQIVFKNDGILDITANDGSSNNFKTIISNSFSGFRFLTNISPTSTTTNEQLTTVENYVRNVEHKYNKIQIGNYVNFGTYSSSVTDRGYNFNTKEIVINGDSNYFEIELASNNTGFPQNDIYFSNIRINRPTLFSSNIVDLPTGAEVTIRFKVTGTAGIMPYIVLSDSDTNLNSNIRSSYNDSLVGGTYSNRISISNLNTSPYGDVITFTKSNTKWDITNINRYREFNTYITSANTQGTIGTSGNVDLTFGPLLGSTISSTGVSRLVSITGSVSSSTFTTSNINVYGKIIPSLNGGNDVVVSGIGGVSLRRNNITKEAYLSGGVSITNISASTYNAGQQKIFRIATLSNRYRPTSSGASWFQVKGEVRFSTNVFLLDAVLDITRDGQVYLHWKEIVDFGTSPVAPYAININIPNSSWLTS